MTDKNTKKNKISWFKAFGSVPNQSEQDKVDQSIDDTKFMDEKQLNNMRGFEEMNTQNENVLLLKDNQDKIATDLINSLENMIKDRQLILYENKDIAEQLSGANETIHRIKEDLGNKEHLLLEKSKDIRGLESKLTNKQMAYDQLLEDYKEYQNTSNSEYENISIKLDTEINKYEKLNDELNDSQHKSMLRITELEERIRNLEIENNQYKQQYQKVIDEKSELMKTINDFTDRMSFSLSTKTSTKPPDSK